MDRRKKHRKPKFVSESPSEIIMRIHAICDDTGISNLEKVQALNRTEKSIMREFGFFSEQYKDLKAVIDHCKQSLVRASESCTEVLSHDSGGTACYADP